MFKFNLKKGLTLAEVLLVMLIIGITSVIMVTSVKPEYTVQKYMYSNLYNGISDAFYNAMLNRHKDDGNKNPFKLDNEGNNDGPKVLCEGMIEFINASSRSCNNEKTINEDAQFFNKDKANNTDEKDKYVQFTANNGMKFYFSKMLTAEYELNGTEQKFNYFLVFVDTNGKKRPNTIQYTGNKNAKSGLYSIIPDVFAFALLESGRTVPLGIPEFDERLIQARIGYYNKFSEILYNFSSVPYYVAKAMAWGYKTSEWNDNQAKQEAFINVDEPFTVNDVIRKNLKDSLIFENDIPALPEGVGLFEDKDNTTNTTYRCNLFDIDNCFVVINKYSY